MTAALRQDPYRCGTIAAVLSLDLTQPYLGAMALQLPDGAAFLAGLRQVIRHFRARQFSPDLEQQFPEALLDWISIQYGAAFADYFVRWGEDVFQYSGSDGVQVFLWNSIIRRGGLDGRRDRKPPPQFIEAIRRNLATNVPPNMISASPLTGWDKELYERQSYDESMNAVEWIKSTISYAQFVRAWQEADSIMRPDSRELYAWGLEEAKLLGMPLDRIDEPGNWPGIPIPPSAGT